TVTNTLVTLGAHQIGVCAKDSTEPALEGCASINVTVVETDTDSDTETDTNTEFTTTLVLKHSGLCVNVEQSSQEDGANIVQWNCNGDDNQRFRFEYLGDGTFNIRPVHSDKCCEGLGDSNVVQSSCHGSNSHRFILLDEGGGYYSIINVESNKCLDIAYSSLDYGANLQLWNCTGNDNQKFAVDRQLP
nr:RICIN domain-containing protein [Myxococcota bacterium]